MADARDFVVKPVVSAGARDTARFARGEHARALELVSAIHESGRDAMLQPYLPAVEERGETALFFFGGAFSHAARKPALLGRGAKIDQYAPGFVAARAPSDAELDVARGTLGAIARLGLPAPVVARIDVVPDDDGAPVLIEAELIEPRLFLATSPGAADRYARALREHLDASDAQGGPSPRRTP
jgi:O-ureido-D-serine cyclo-ligase